MLMSHIGNSTGLPKLLQINATANWGSTGKIAESIGIAAMNAGWDSYIAYGRWSNPSQSILIRIGGRFNKYFHFIEQRIFDNEGLCSRLVTRRLIRQIEGLRPDVVQLHNIHDHYLNYKILFEYLNKTGIPVVWTFHDCWAFTGHCFHFVTKGCKRWHTGCYNCPMKSVWPKTLFDRSMVNYGFKKSLFGGCKNMTVVTCSDWMAGFVRQSFLKDKRLEVIKNGVDLNAFKPSVDNHIGNFYNVLAVSSIWNDDKGLSDLFKLRELLPNKYRITIVGLSANQMSSLPAGVIGFQRTQNIQELVRFYSESNVFINPTYADTFPTVNLEALACGTPVVTYRTGGSPEAIDESTGIVIEPRNVEGLADAVRLVCERNRMKSIEACRKRAENYFDKDKCFKKYVTLYEELIGNGV